MLKSNKWHFAQFWANIVLLDKKSNSPLKVQLTKIELNFEFNFWTQKVSPYHLSKVKEKLVRVHLGPIKKQQGILPIL